MFGSKKRDEDRRFAVVYRETHNSSEETRILLDRNTGVQYLFHRSGLAGGLTILGDGG